MEMKLSHLSFRDFHIVAPAPTQSCFLSLLALLKQDRSYDLSDPLLGPSLLVALRTTAHFQLQNVNCIAICFVNRHVAEVSGSPILTWVGSKLSMVKGENEALFHYRPRS